MLKRASIAKMAGLLIVLGLAASLAAAWLWCPAAQSTLRGWAMLFTQKSALTLAGALRAAKVPVPSAMLYMVFQNLVLPHLPPLMYVANQAVFGSVAGIAVSLGGALLSAGLCYGLARLVFAPLRDRCRLASVAAPAAPLQWIFVAGAGLLLPGGLAPLSYLCGFAAVPFRQFLLGTGASRLPVLILYAVLCNMYATTLPAAAVLGCRAVGLAVLLAGGGLIKTRGKRKRCGVQECSDI